MMDGLECKIDQGKNEDSTDRKYLATMELMGISDKINRNQFQV